MEIEICDICKEEIDDNEFGGDCCNFCYDKTICEKCWDIAWDNKTITNMWVCSECDHP